MKGQVLVFILLVFLIFIEKHLHKNFSAILAKLDIGICILTLLARAFFMGVKPTDCEILAHNVTTYAVPNITLSGIEQMFLIFSRK